MPRSTPASPTPVSERLALCTLALFASLGAAQTQNHPAARTWIVAPSGGDYTAIQPALNAAQAGDIVLVKDKPGGYREQVSFPRSGSASAGSIELRAHPGHHPILDGTGSTGGNMVTIRDRSYVTVAGFEIRNHRNLNDGSGIRIVGAGSHLALLDNTIHDIRGQDAMGITVLGTSETASIRELRIEHNLIYDCDPAKSEALVLNGNVERFVVAHNVVRDVNNIGIDFIGGEAWVNRVFVCRNGVCRGNRVSRANANYGGGYGAGIYVDGGRDILIEANVVTGCDLGIEVGAENPGFVASGIVVSNNIIFRNQKAGLVFGGYDSSVGRVKRCRFVNNTCFGNDTLGDQNGELWIQWAEDNTIRDNVFVASLQNILLSSGPGSVNNSLDYNTWFTTGTPALAKFSWQGRTATGFAAYRALSGEDRNSQFIDPALVAPSSDNFELGPTSPAIDAADPRVQGASRDAAGNPRIQDGRLDGTARLDAGAFEFVHARLSVSGPLVAGTPVTASLIGTSGLPAVLLLGSRSAATAIPPLGSVFVDLSAPWTAVAVGSIPTTTRFSVPSGIPRGATVVFQGICSRGTRGNTTNSVELRGR